MEKLTRVNFTNLDKILFPKIGVTKAKFIEYYIKMAPKILPFLKDRSLVLNRYPEGVDKQGFYAKNAPGNMPNWIKTATFYSLNAKHNVNYIISNDLDTLIWLANLAAVEIHIPLSSLPQHEIPDFAFFDVDPEPPATFDDAIEVALLAKEKLDQLRFKSYVKTSGKKGLHILVPVVPDYTFKETRSFVHAIGIQLMKENKKVASEFSDTKTPGRIFVDYTQNSHGRTMVCPYSLRVSDEATVSMPVEWNDLKKKIKPAEFNIESAPKVKKEPWKNIFLERQEMKVENLVKD